MPLKNFSTLTGYQGVSETVGRFLGWAVFGLALWFVYLIYMSGVSGTMILDSAQNLEPLENLTTSSFSEAEPIIFGNVSGPLGRPVSMFSFWLDVTRSGMSGEVFRETNILIHLFISSSLALLAYQLVKPFATHRGQAQFVAILTALLWALHPENISTVQYVVQRMTQLSAMFSLLSVILYIQGRHLLGSNEKVGLACLALAYFPFALLAVFSKENAILLILIFFILEKTVLRSVVRTTYFEYCYKVGVVGLLAIISVGVLASIPGFIDDYQYRTFTMWERLLTEFRVVAMQLRYIFLPSISEFTLFHERLPHSTSLIAPISTLLSMLLHATLVGIAFRFRKGYPLLAFSIFWFYGWHLIESTIVPLELHFEHRNYLPMMGPLIGAIYYLSIFAYGLGRRSGRVLVRLCTIGWLTVFSFLCLQLNSLWARPGELTYHWYVTNPESSRTKHQLAFVYNALNENDKAMDVFQEGIDQFPGEITFLLAAWNYACEHNYPLSYSISDLASDTRLKYEGDSLQVQFQLLRLNALARNCEFFSHEALEQLMVKIDELPINPIELSNIYFEVSGIYISMEESFKGYEALSHAYDLHPNEFVLRQHILLALYLEDFETVQVVLNFARSEIESGKLQGTRLASEIETLEQLVRDGIRDSSRQGATI